MTDDRTRDEAATDTDIGTDATMAPPDASDGTAATIAAPVATPVPSQPVVEGANATLLGAPPAPRLPARRQRRTSGGSLAEEMRGASADRLHEVDRDEYEVMGEFARGGLGRIFRALDHRSGRIVAIKEVLRADNDIVVRFAREALVTANLQHPSIVPVYEIGRWPSGEPFFAMKLVSGKSLDELVKAATSTAERLALLPHVIDVADALAYAHSEHIIHRDLKPANVLVGAYGETVVIDWGLAKNLVTGEETRELPTTPSMDDGRMVHADPTDSSETIAGAVVGTPAYMAPEQARGEPLDERADVYAIGAMLYQILGGARPYASARTVEEILLQIIEGPPRPLREFAPELPRELIAIVEKAMAPDARHRYADAKGLAADLRRFSTGQLVAAHQYSAWQLISRWVRANRAVVATASVAVVALALFGAYSVHRIRSERDEASRQRGLAISEQHVAEHRLGEGLQELARQALVANAPERALPLLVGAFAAQPEGQPILRVLAARAVGAYQGLTSTVIADDATFSAQPIADGSLIVAAGNDNKLTAWDARTGAPRWRVDGPHHALLSPDEKRVLGAAGNELMICAVADGTKTNRWPIGSAAATPSAELFEVLAWSPDGAMIAAGGGDGTIVVAGTSSSSLVSIANAHAGKIRAVEFSPDGKRIASGGDDGQVRIWQVDGIAANSHALATLPANKGAITIEWLDDDHVIVADLAGGASEWSISSKAVVQHFDHGDPLYGATLSPDHSTLATYAQDERVMVWDVGSGAKLATLGNHGPGVNQAIWVDASRATNSGDDAYRLVTSDESGVARVWQARRGALVQTLPSADNIFSLAQSHGRVVISGRGRRIRLWDVAAMNGLRAIGRHTGRVRRALFDASGKTIYTASGDGTAAAIDVATGAIRFTVGASSPSIEAPLSAGGAPPAVDPHGMRWIDLSPDGKTIATSAEDGVVALWNAADGTPLRTVVGHVGWVRTVRFSRDGSSIITAGQDGTARRWDVASGKELLRVTGERSIQDARLSNDGSRLITLTAESPEKKRDGQPVTIWDASTGAKLSGATLENSRLAELTFDRDGMLFTAQSSGATVVDPATAKTVRVVDQSMIYSLDTSQDGASIVSGNAGGKLAMHSGRTGAMLFSWSADAHIVVFARLRADGKLLASVGGDMVVRLWDPRTGEQLDSLPPLSEPAVNLTFSPDGRQLLVGGMGGYLWLWNVGPFDGDAAALAARNECANPLRLDGTALLPATLKPCSAK